MNRRFAILASAYSNDPRQAARNAQASGFLGLMFDAYSAPLSIPELSASGRREFRRVLASHNQQLVGLRADAGKNGLGPGADVDQLLHRLNGVLESAAALQAPLVCLDLGPLPSPPRQTRRKASITADMAGAIILPSTLAAPPVPEATNLPAAPSEMDRAFVMAVDGALAELGRMADRYSVAVALHSDLAALDAIEAVIQHARCPWFGVELSPSSILRDEWSMDDAFSRLGTLIRHVRACDALAGTDRRTKPVLIGQGNTDWGKFIASLSDAGYREWITLDPTELPDRTGAAMVGLKHLQAIA